LTKLNIPDTINTESGWKIKFTRAQRKLPRGKWTFEEQPSEFLSPDWDAFLTYLDQQYGPDAQIEELPVDLPLYPEFEERRFSVSPNPETLPGVLIELRAWQHPAEPLHLINVTFLAPGRDARHAGEMIYDRLQDKNLDEHGCAFVVTSAAQPGGNPQTLPGLDSGEHTLTDVLIEHVYG
jgi:hypothetical protein